MCSSDLHRLASASIVECLAHHADSQPDALCLADHKRSLTYSQAWERICGFAEHVRAQGVCEGACVAIECNQGIEYLVGVLAIQLAGCVAVPIEKNAAVARQLEIVAETCSELYIGKTALEGMEQVAFSDIASVCDYSKTASCERVAFPAGEDTAELLFSTGTTGKSKGIVITHRNNMAIAENIIGGVEMGPTGAEAIPMPLSHSHGLRTAYANIACGRAVLVVDGVLALKRLFNIMDDYHATAQGARAHHHADQAHGRGAEHVPDQHWNQVLLYPFGCGNP